MRRPSPRMIVIAAAVLVLGGTVCAVVFAVLQTRCDSAAFPAAGPVVIPHAAACSGYGVGAGIGVGVLAVGAVLVAVAAVLSTPLFRREPVAPGPGAG